MTRAILTGPAAADVFRSAPQRLMESPPEGAPTGLNAFSSDWRQGYSQHGNLTVGVSLSHNLFFETGYVYVSGAHLGRTRDLNYPDSEAASRYLAAGGSQSGLLAANYFRPLPEVSEIMTFEAGANSVFHGLRLNLRGRIGARTTLHASYTFSKAIDDAEEILPHSRAQNMRDFRSERGPALYDQRHRLVFAAVFETKMGTPSTSFLARALSGWSFAPVLEAGSGRPVNLLLGFDNNLDQYPGSDRPDLAAPGNPGAISTRYGCLTVPSAGTSGNLGRNACTGPGYASLSLRLQRRCALGEHLQGEVLAEGFNLLNRLNVRGVNPNYARAGEPLSAFDPRQVQLGVRLRF